MKVTVIIHEAEEGGFWAEVPALPGCATQGETREELLANLREAVEGCLVAVPGGFVPQPGGRQEVVELPVDPLWTRMESIWAGQRARGHVPRTREEIDAEVNALRDQAEEEMLALERFPSSSRSAEAPDRRADA